MPARISVAMSKKCGPPECESLGVTCSMEFGDNLPAPHNPETFQRAVDSAVAACHRALQEESIRLGTVNGTNHGADCT